MYSQLSIIFFSVLAHESAHAIVARWLGYAVTDIELLPFGGVAKIEQRGEFARGKVFCIAAAGPLLSLLLAVAGFSARLWGQSSFMATFTEVNFILAIFNLLPAFPLDGGQMCRALLVPVMSYQRATERLVYISRIISFTLMVKVFGDAIFLYITNISLLIIAIFIYLSAEKEIKNASFYNVRVMAYKKVDLLQRGCLEVKYYTVLPDTQLKKTTLLFVAECCAVILVLDEMHKICGTFTEFEIWDSLSERGLQVRFKDLLS